jgi:hypothetical protein
MPGLVLPGAGHPGDTNKRAALLNSRVFPHPAKGDGLIDVTP